MTKLDDIPQDVQLTVNQIWHELVGALDRDGQEQILSRAIMAEREGIKGSVHFRGPRRRG